jgi:ketosteroid isomerase-like protein
MASLEQCVEELLAREAIRDLPLRYCDCVWREDAAGLAALFTDNGSFTFVIRGTETAVRGRQAIAEFFAEALRMRPRPYIHNHVVELRADGFASGRCYLDLRSGNHDMAWLGAGWYADEYMRTLDGWKFQSRLFRAVRMDELPAHLGET